MTRRTVSSIIACVLLVMLFAVAAFLPVPYVTMSPGPTVDVLAESKGEEIVQVEGHRRYDTDGRLELTTVSVTGPTQGLSLAEALAAWFDRTRAVYPRDVVYAPDESVEEVRRQSRCRWSPPRTPRSPRRSRSSASSCRWSPRCSRSTTASPAEGKLRRGTGSCRSTARRSATSTAVTELVQKAGVGGDATFVVRRDGATKSVTVQPEAAPDDPTKALVGVTVGGGYDFPFDVSVNISDDIGGPERGPDLLARRLRHADAGALTGEPDRGDRNHHRATEPLVPSEGSSRRSSPPPTRAPRSSWSRRTTAPPRWRRASTRTRSGW